MNTTTEIAASLFVSLSLFISYALVHIIYSSSIDQYYIGHSENIENRLFRHNNSRSKVTKKSKDWKLLYSEMFATRMKLHKEK